MRVFVVSFDTLIIAPKAEPSPKWSCMILAWFVILRDEKFLVVRTTFMNGMVYAILKGENLNPTQGRQVTIYGH